METKMYRRAVYVLVLLGLLGASLHLLAAEPEMTAAVFVRPVASVSAPVTMTESDKLCRYLNKLTEQANVEYERDDAKALNSGVSALSRLDDLMDIEESARQLEKAATEAVARHETFEKFKKDMATHEVRVVDWFKPVYLGYYTYEHCGQISALSAAGAVALARGAKAREKISRPSGGALAGLSTTSIVGVEKRFNPTDNPYYAQMRLDPTER